MAEDGVVSANSEDATECKPPVDVDAPAYYVAIGASAGGLEAIESFFTSMPPDTGLAFIVIQHLSPDYKSLMAELLSKKTSMPVHRAQDGVKALPNNVYLIQPKKNLTIFHGKLLFSDPDTNRGINLPIDIFPHSLAEDQADKAIAIILSGTGSDGTRGVRMIKQHGGMVMVQNEESAKFDGMPRAAASTGLADFILPPDEMPKQLVAYVKSPYASKAERSESLLKDEDDLTRIFALLRERCKVDFTFYKPSTVVRRIERRITVNQFDDIKDYVGYIHQYPAEVTALYRELLIDVTSFFRDPAVFERLEKRWLPEMLANTESRELRFWVAGCSTGEEAYSLAILTRECLQKAGFSRDIKIFATDIDRDSIHYAAAGVYPESIAADLPPHLLAKYFYRRDDNYQISRTIREMVVFAPHNLIKDPPFTNISLISCRNLLIYLQPVLQRKVFEFFNFSLNANGILMLGTSESTGDMSDYFEPIEPALKLYHSRGRFKPLHDIPKTVRPADTRFSEMRDRFSQVRRVFRANEEERVLERFLECASQDFLPLAMIVNEQLELLHVIGDARNYFTLPSGKMHYDISKMAVKELAIPLATGVQKVFRQRQEMRFSNIRCPREDGMHLVEMRIRLLPEKRSQEPLAAVFLSEIKKNEAGGASGAVISYDLSREVENRIQDLEQDLQFTRENLQATIEELETSNEELQATNEELLASNEELQSTNEELQSTNEELQSTNEELYTVNSEYQSKIMELTELHNDVDNLLSLSHIGTMLLDENLEVRRFSPTMTKIFKLIDSDMGRPVTHLSHYLKHCDPVYLIRETQRNKTTIEQEVQTEDGSWYLMRVAPYEVGPKSFSGAVISFVNIDDLKRAEANYRESQQLFSTIANSTPSMIWMSGLDKACYWFNASWLTFTGRSMEQERGNGWTEGVHPDDYERCLDTYVEAFDKQVPFVMEYRLRRHDGEYRWILDDGRPQYNASGEFAGYIGACMDIHTQKETERRLREVEEYCKKNCEMPTQ